MTTATASQKMQAIFASGNIPVKEVNVFGRHCIVTCLCHESATKVARMLQSSGWKVRGPVESVDEAKDQSDRKTFHPKYIKVYRVGGKLI